MTNQILSLSSLVLLDFLSPLKFYKLKHIKNEVLELKCDSQNTKNIYINKVKSSKL